MGTINAATIATQLQHFGRSSDTCRRHQQWHAPKPKRGHRGVKRFGNSCTQCALTCFLLIIGEVVSLQAELNWFGEHADACA